LTFGAPAYPGGTKGPFAQEAGGYLASCRLGDGRWRRRALGNLAVNESAPSIDIRGNYVTNARWRADAYPRQHSDDDAFACDPFQNAPLLVYFDDAGWDHSLPRLQWSTSGVRSCVGYENRSDTSQTAPQARSSSCCIICSLDLLFRYSGVRGPFRRSAG